MNFSELGISEALIQALEKENIVQTLPIQVEAIPALREGKDAYVSAETGTGKTLAYLLPAFELINPAVANAQVIVLTPTHELASQVHQQALRLAQNSGLAVKSLLLIGGTNTKRQVEKLKKKPQLIIGSTGRILDLIQMKKLKLKDVRMVIIDEADRMLFGDSLSRVCELLDQIPERPQLVFASATEQQSSLLEIQKIAPEMIKLSVGANQINPDIEHVYFIAEERNKADMLRRLIRAIEPEKSIVFVHRNKDAALVRAKMEYYNIPVVDLHGTQDKLERKQAMDHFRQGKITVMIASDIAARGLDIKGVTHIFNYDAPTSSKDYLHRVGRTGRAGEEGYAVSLMTRQEERLIKRYEEELDIVITAAMIREGEIYEAEAE